MPVGTPLRAPRRAPIRTLLRAFAGSALAVAMVVGSTATAEAVTPGTVAGSSVAKTQVSGQQLVRQAGRKAARKERIKRMLRIVRAQKGDPYQYGAAGPHRFDCSGLVYYSAHRAGFRNVPRTSSQQGHFMRRIGRAAMRRGDFVFFTGSSGVYHVGVFAGRSGGRRWVIHAPGSGQRVTKTPIWTDRWFAGTLR